jgi:hypothetical protein
MPKPSPPALMFLNAVDAMYPPDLQGLDDHFSAS